MSAPTLSSTDTDRPGGAVAAGSAGAAAGGSGQRRGSRLAAMRARAVDWLDRPMTSYHLLLGVFFLLLGFGLLMVLSSSAVTAYRRDGSVFSVFRKQLMFAGVGLIGFYVALRVRLDWLRRWSTVGMIMCLGLLVVVLGFGPVNGARSWIRIGSLSFQPSEVAKFAVVLWGAHVLASRRQTLGNLKDLLIPLLPVAGLMSVLLMLEPDLGQMATLWVIVFALLFFAGASWKIFGIVSVIGIAGIGGLAMAAPYRLLRLVSFLNPTADAKGAGLQLLQGLYGMGDGGWFGVGLGQSTAKWAYLPHAESDFIFAIIGEELGFVGATVVVLLYLVLLLVGLRIARRNTDPFIKLVAATSTAWLVGQAAINIFYVLGLLPVTGLTLPLISAGGTSLIVTMVIFGLLASFSRREPQAMAALQDNGPGPIARFFGIGIPGAGFEDAAKVAARAQRASERPNREHGQHAKQRARDAGQPAPGATRARAVHGEHTLSRGNRPAPDSRRIRPADPAVVRTTTGLRRPQPPTGVRGWLGFPSGNEQVAVAGRPAQSRVATGRPQADRRRGPDRTAAAEHRRDAPSRNPSGRRQVGLNQPPTATGLRGWLGFGPRGGR